MIGRPILRLEDVASTQDVAFRLGELGAREGTVVVAKHQRAGRGRAGRTWVASPGAALLFSVLLRPERPLPGVFSLLVADAIAETVSDAYGLDPRVKWPNDVLIDSRKLSGVLIQARNGMAVLGIGLNVRTEAIDLPEGATSLRAETGQMIDPAEMLERLLPAIDQRYRAVMTGDVASTVSRVQARLAMRGERVTLRDGDREMKGRVKGLRHDGALLLEVDDGIRAVVSGELVRGPRPVSPEAMPGSGKAGIL